MKEYPHFILGTNFASQHEAFRPKSGQFASVVPDRDRSLHYSMLKAEYDEAVSSEIGALDQFRKDNRFGAEGVYLDIDLATGGEGLKRLDSRKATRLMNVSYPSNEQEQPKSAKATVYLPTSKRNWLDEKLDKYNDPDKDSSKGPRERVLINNIDAIQRSSVKSFFGNEAEYSTIRPEECNFYEIWIADGSSSVVESTFEKVRRLGLVISEKHISFKQMSVFLICADLRGLEKLPYALDYLSEIRVYKQPGILLAGEPVYRQEWTDLLKTEIVADIDDNSPVIGIIDTGVNNAHPLIQDFLPDGRTDCVISGLEHIDEDDHGTGMGGLCLFGDIANLIYQRGDISVRHKLASVKIFSNKHNQGSKELYGVLTENAVEKLEEMGASIFCMALTENDEDCTGVPSSWSSAVDMILYHGGACDRLMFVPVGNIEDHESFTQDTYQDFCLSRKAQSPSQALNAITVGAYTEKVIDDVNDGIPLASPQEISPYSRTSYMWDSRRVKPDIVMEGGNVLMHELKGALHSLNLITTSSNLNQSFQGFYATSAATALASRLAAKVKSEYPDLSSLAIRALLIHSAEWSDGMKRIPKDQRLSMYGYGIPSEDKVLKSRNKYVTCVFENSISPYSIGNSGRGLKYAGYQLYDLPWPVELLQSMGKETVRLKVTLSYYIDPAPGERGRLNRYRYHNASLYFDLKAPTESTESFIARHNKLEDAPNTAGSASERWKIGMRNRQSGSVQSDWIKCTAAELADCGKIMVYPGPGWWKEQSIDRIDNSIKYALVISIETQDTPIYAAVKQTIENQIQLQSQIAI